MRKGNLTGIKDVDNIILDNMNDRDLLSFCSTNKYNADTVCNEDFWKRRFKNKFGYSTWKKAYLSKISERYYIVWWSEHRGTEVVSNESEKNTREILISEIESSIDHLADVYEDNYGEKYQNINLEKLSTQRLIEICKDLSSYIYNDLDVEGWYVLIDVIKGQKL